MKAIKRILLALTVTALTLTVPTVPGLAADPPPNTDQVIDGSSGPGALYRLVRPANWNGELVVYAHGYVSPDQKVIRSLGLMTH